MSPRHFRTVPALILALLAAGPSANATETDQYYALGRDIRDSTAAMNWKMNREIALALHFVNRRDPEGRLGCRDVARKIFERLRLLGWQKIELWADLSRHVEQVPGEDEDFSDWLHHKSIYRYSAWWDWGMSVLSITRTMNLAGDHVGADKLSHYSKQGFVYYERYLDDLEAGMSREDAVEEMIRWGIQTENSNLGLMTSEVFSFGDLEANYQGFRFYQGLCEGDSPSIRRTANGWERTRPFDWREYVSPLWDEV